MDGDFLGEHFDAGALSVYSSNQMELFERSTLRIPGKELHAPALSCGS
jgi:hypothetical protein